MRMTTVTPYKVFPAAFFLLTAAQRSNQLVRAEETTKFLRAASNSMDSHGDEERSLQTTSIAVLRQPHLPGPTQTVDTQPLVDAAFDSVTTDASVQEQTYTRSIKYYGNNGSPSHVFPLPRCAGDCDSDAECQSHLVCHERNANEPVPGCLGGLTDDTDNDYCVYPGDLPPPTTTPAPISSPRTPAPEPVTPAPVLVTKPPVPVPVTPAPVMATKPPVPEQVTPAPVMATKPPVPAPVTPAPVTPAPVTPAPVTPAPIPAPTTSPPTNQIIVVGNDDDGIFPLTHCEGDCDSDSDCFGNLVCFQRSSRDAVPGCIGGTAYSGSEDFCVRPQDLPTPAPVPPGSNVAVFVGNDNDPVFPLQRCQADCDSNSDCFSDLICYQRSGGGPVPGCVGVTNEMDTEDFCVRPQDLPTPSPVTPNPTPPPITASGFFRLKLHWEEGYRWQEETIEKRWCAFHNYRRSYCYYNNVDDDDCQSNRMYIDDCGTNYGYKLWQFVDLGNGQVQIKTAIDNRCWARYGKRIYLETCDSGESNQRWSALNGSFGSYRFEISQNDGQCVSNDHHPKEREVVEMHSCEGSRNSDTSFWTRA